MTTRVRTDVVVVGGGVIGLAVAWQAATAGVAVTLADPRPGRGAGWAAAGMLAPVGEAHFGEDALTSLNLEAARAWPGFARDLEEASGRPVGYLADGTLLIAVDGSDRAASDDLLAYRMALGLRARRLSAGECRSEEPLLAPGIRGGADLGDDHQVDNRCVLDALVAACRAVGVTMVEEEVAAVDIRGGAVAGVTLAHGGFRSAAAVVVAAGCWSGQLRGIPGRLLPPVRPVKGVTLRLQAPAGMPTLARTVRGLVHGRSCYLVPRRDGTVVVGATVEEKGFDLAVAAGAVGDLLGDARRLVPSLEEYELFDTTAGLRPGSPDNAPIVGATDVRGLVMATGHYRNGFLLAPATAREVVGMLTGAHPGPGRDGPPGVTTPGGFARFGPGRFATGGAHAAGTAGTGRSEHSVEPDASEGSDGRRRADGSDVSRVGA